MPDHTVASLRVRKDVFPLCQLLLGGVCYVAPLTRVWPFSVVHLPGSRSACNPVSVPGGGGGLRAGGVVVRGGGLRGALRSEHQTVVAGCGIDAENGCQGRQAAWTLLALAVQDAHMQGSI